MSFFITFEGIEGSGKSTQIGLLEKHLQDSGYQVLCTREPGGCPIADNIRSILLHPDNANMRSRTELLLYAAARTQHVEEVVRPALEHNQIVLCDRFFDATTAYQGAGRGLDVDLIKTLNSLATAGLKPDLTLLFDFEAEEGLLRARQRNQAKEMQREGRFELEELDFHRRVRSGYLDLAAAEKRFRIIDARGDIETVHDQVVDKVDNFLSIQAKS